MSTAPAKPNHDSAVPTRSARRPQLSHLHLFAVGWVYYLVLPVMAARLGLFEKSDAFDLMRRYSSPHDPWLSVLIGYVLLMPVMVALGTVLARRIPRLRQIATPLSMPSHILLPLYAVLLATSTMAASSNLFSGYSADMNLASTGPIATLQMALLFQYLAAKSAGLQSATRWIGLLLIISSIVLLGMGGRLYVLSTLTALYFYWWKFTASGTRARRRSLIALIVVPLLFGFIGMWRLGIFDLSTLGFYIFAEPLFTSISAFTMMEGDGWLMLDAPKDFFSAFLNIVPTLVWPNKASMVMSLADSPLSFDAPFGALSIVTSTIGNFGFIGGLFFVALVGFIMERVRLAARAPAGLALYCYLACLLPFMFFRDPFQVQVKVVLTGFLLLWINRLLASLQNRRRSAHPWVASVPRLRKVSTSSL